jgi:RimJ/RimL family protein N-acetyltransferase
MRVNKSSERFGRPLSAKWRHAQQAARAVARFREFGQATLGRITCDCARIVRPAWRGIAVTVRKRRPRVNRETERLILRPQVLSDVPSLFAFLGDAEAMRHTHADASRRDCRRHVVLHEWRRRRNGYAPWTILSKADGGTIGWGELYDDPFDPGWGVEVGYFFHPRTWGIGYATELTTECTALADTVLRLPAVNAFARRDNVGSCRVLEKAGFTVVRFVPELTRLLYRRVRREV